MIEQVQRAFNIDLKRCCYMPGFLFLLSQQEVVQVFKNRHVFRRRIIKIVLIYLMDTTVNDCFLYRLQAFFASHDQFAERQDEIRFQCKRVVFFRVVAVDVHRIDMMRARRTDLDNLPFEPVYQRRILSFRIADDNVIIRYQKCIGDLTLGAE